MDEHPAFGSDVEDRVDVAEIAEEVECHLDRHAVRDSVDAECLGRFLGKDGRDIGVLDEFLHL